MKLNRITLATMMAILGTSAAFAQAEAPKSLGQFGDWTAYSYQGPKGKSCYALATPKDKAPKGVNRDPIYLFVTHRPAESVRNEISVVNGYTFKEGAKASYEVKSSKGNAAFGMFAKDDTAWLQNVSDQPKAIAAMKQGKDVVVKGTSARGTATTDVYSLNGISKALDRIDAECK